MPASDGSSEQSGQSALQQHSVLVAAAPETAAFLLTPHTLAPRGV
jgi:hypothetical protein